MCCADEVGAVESALKSLRGVNGVQVNLMRGSVTIDHDSSVNPQTLSRAIGRAGLKALPEGGGGGEKEAESDRRRQLAAVVIAGVLTAVGLLVGWIGSGLSWVAPWLFAGAIVSGGSLVLPKALRAIARRSLDMNVLMTVAVLGAVVIGEWGEAAMVVFLFALSELLEAFSLGRARRAIRSLMQLSPETALVRRGAEFVEAPVESVEVGEIITVRSGARIPLDGEVISGRSGVNQAPITGESMPVEKEAGATVFAGTINGEGSLEVRVTKLSTDSTLARIIHLIEEAQSQKAPSERFVDVFARYYTPAVFAAAILVAIAPPLLLGGEWLVWFYRALVLLVIACPCALVISTPVSIVSGLTAMARRGVLIKGGIVLEAVGRLTAVAMDKTGTITEGRPRVLNVVSFGDASHADVVRLAASVNVHSDHPLARAIETYARELGIEATRSTNFRAVSGRGAEAEVEGARCFIGNRSFADELGILSEELGQALREVEAKALSVVIMGRKPGGGKPGVALGLLAIGDAIRPDAAEAIRALHAAGVEEIIMLSGDNQRSVDAIARQAGIDQAYGELLPDQKVERIRELVNRKGRVGMVGDGVNDAPAMAHASVGIAMGAAGTDTALETADMALMEDDLGKLAEAVHLGRRTVRIIQANIAFALGIKAIFLVLAITGHTSLWLAILADTGATLVVIANSLRLLRRRPRQEHHRLASVQART